MAGFLFLDDTRTPESVTWVMLPASINDWDIVRSYAQFVEYINRNGLPEFIAFDHDLGDEHYKDFFRCRAEGQPLDYDAYTEKTGYDCVKWLVNYCIENDLDFPDYIVHSMNNIGADNIRGLVSSYKKHRDQK